MKWTINYFGAKKLSGAPIVLLMMGCISLLAGCDPILEIDGAFFPAWLVCMIAAGFMLGGIRWVVYRLGIEPFVGPRVTVYFCVYLSCTLGLWLGFFRL